MLKKICLTNFKCFDHIELDLTKKNGSPKSLSMIYGENGVGKSNLMSAIILLIELLGTLNVRDIYEEILNRERLFSDENVDKEMRQRMLKGLRDMPAIINDCRMVDNTETIIAEYEFSIDGSSGNYCVELGNNEIIHERLEFRLNKRRGVYFDCRPGKLFINSAISTDKDFLLDIQANAKRFWGKHSMLAIIEHEIFDKSSAFGWDNVAEYYKSVIFELHNISCDLGVGSRHFSHINAPIGVFDNATQGKIEKKDEEQLELAEKIINSFMRAVNKNVSKAYYKCDYGTNLIRYKLYVEKMIAGQYREIPFEKESTGDQGLLKFLRYILCACMKGTVILDEVDTGIHEALFQKLICEIEPLINGQLIMTTHNTMLMEAPFARESVYILEQNDDGHKIARCVNEYEGRTYQNNNIRNKYLNDSYGGLPVWEENKFSKILDEFKHGYENLDRWNT